MVAGRAGRMCGGRGRRAGGGARLAPRHVSDTLAKEGTSAPGPLGDVRPLAARQPCCCCGVLGVVGGRAVSSHRVLGWKIFFFFFFLVRSPGGGVYSDYSVSTVCLLWVYSMSTVGLLSLGGSKIVHKK